ncbi:MAG: ABC transporter permease [Acidimicrobiales bacterium]
MAILSELNGSRELIANLTLRELRGKYKRSVLGWAWSLLNPLSTMLIFSLVFAYFLQIKVRAGRPSGLRSFAFYLLIGLLPWNFLSNGINGSMSALVSNSNLIKKVYFPRQVLVIANVASWVVSLLIEMSVLSIALLVVGSFVIPWLVPVLLLVVIQTAFVAGIGLGLSVLNVYFRDMEHLTNIGLQLWFYATPIVYPLELVKGRGMFHGVDVYFVYRLNPMVRFVQAYRDCLYDLRLPAFGDLAYLVVAAAVALVGGMAIFIRLEPKLAEEL